MRWRKCWCDREYGDDSDYSYYSVIFVGGIWYVCRCKRNFDGMYGDSELYYSGDIDFDLKCELIKIIKMMEELDSDYSYVSERSVGGMRYEVKWKCLWDVVGKVIGYGDKVVLGEVVSDVDFVRMWWG